jgi:N-acetylglucosaminyl-diphospho-decaprenol L-rhamnosyltransferase
MTNDRLDEIANGRPRVSIIVPYWNTPSALTRCLAAVPGACGGVSREVVIVDNGSALPTRVKHDPTGGIVVLVNDRNRGFAAACNQGAAVARGEVLLFLNSDAVLQWACVESLLRALEADARLAVVAPSQRAGTGRRSEFGLRFLGPLSQAAALMGVRGARYRSKSTAAGVEIVPWVTGAAMMVPACVFRHLGGFDEGFFFYEEDEDFCWRLRARGYRVATVSTAAVLHRGGESTLRAGDWPTRALYTGQVRFVARRCGRVAAVLYRFAVGAAVLAKMTFVMICGWYGPARRDNWARILEVVWQRTAAVVTTAE